LKQPREGTIIVCWTVTGMQCKHLDHSHLNASFSSNFFLVEHFMLLWP